jgi:hypothetical protein
MTSKTQTEQYLRNVALPEQTNSYTVISHGVIIDTVRQMLTDNGFTIKEELYKGEANGNIALGFMQLENSLDPDMSMTFNWANSYNKQVRFSCAIGGFIYDNSTPFVSGTSQGKWNRKHTGTALDETKEVIEAMIVSAHDHFAEIIAMKEQFKSIKLSRKEYAKLSGLFYFDKALISPEQASILKREYDNSSFDYSDKGTLWEYYKMLMFAVVDQSPKAWYKQQAEISNYINIMYNISKTLVAPGEANLNSMHFAEQEANVSDISFEPNVSAQHPVTPEDAHDTAVTEDPMKNIDKLIDAQNLIKEPMRGPVEEMTKEVEVTEEEDTFNWDISATEEVELTDASPEFEEVIPTEQKTIDLSDIEGEYSLDELPTVIETIEKRIEEAKAPVMSEEQIEMVKEEHGIIETGEPDQEMVGAQIIEEDSEIEAMFEMIEDEVEEVEEETPWYTGEEPTQQDTSVSPTIIPASMREAVADILENSYGNKRQVVDSVEDTDSVMFILDSQEFFHVDK